MKISRASWHYRFLLWTYGKWRVPNNLCPYVDKLLLAILVSPFVFAWKATNLLGKFLVAFESLALSASAALYIVWRSWVGILAGHVVVYGDLAAIVLAGKLYEWVGEHGYFHRQTKFVQPKKPRQPTLLEEWLRAKHRRICPMLEFEGEPL